MDLNIDMPKWWAVLLGVVSFLAQAGEPLPADTGLAQRLRQQISSGCYGFVDHDPEQVRGYEVKQAFQLTRDGYPWARFVETANLLVQRQEVLVGGSACGNAPPGGTVNLETRRGEGMAPRAVIHGDHHGRINIVGETTLLNQKTMQWRIAARREQGRNHVGDNVAIGDLAAQLDIRPNPGRLIRLDLEAREGNEPIGVAWPVETALPENASRHRSLEQDWSRYRYRQRGLLLAWEEIFASNTQLKLGYSQVRYQGTWDELYLSPQGDPAYPSGFRINAYRGLQSSLAYDAWHGALEQGFTAWQAGHLTRLSLSRIEVGVPDRLLPGQALDNWWPGQKLPAPAVLPATAARRLDSAETRLGLTHMADWVHWQINAGLHWTQFADSNGSERIDAQGLAPILSVAWKPMPAWRIQWTQSRGHTGRQFASLSSSTPHRLQPPGESREVELGVRWQTGGWLVGVAAFAITKPYRFERQTVSVWRGSQAHRGYEATVGWEAPNDRGRIVFTGQALKAKVSGTGDTDLDGKRPPGIPEKRATLYADWKPSPGSLWSLNVLGEYLSSRMTLDDNRVSVPGYVRWDAGVEYHFTSSSSPVTLGLFIRNLADTHAWEWVGGGVGTLLAPRTLAVTVSTTL